MAESGYALVTVYYFFLLIQCILILNQLNHRYRADRCQDINHSSLLRPTFYLNSNCNSWLCAYLFSGSCRQLCYRLNHRAF